MTATPPAAAKVAKRDCSVILFGVTEATANSPQLRLDHDCSQVQAILQRLLSPGDNPIVVEQLYRLGARPHSASDRPRPIKVVLPTSLSARSVLSRSYRLKGLPYSLKPDLSPEDREKRRLAFQELRRLTEEGHKDLMVVNFRVVQKRQLLRQQLTISLQSVAPAPA